MFTLAEHKVKEADPGKVRLYDYARKVFMDYIPTGKGIKKALKSGRILVNGQPGHSGYWVQAGDFLELMELEENPPRPYDLLLDIQLEDDYLAIIHKPAGIVVSGNTYRTIQNAIVDQLGSSSAKDALKWPRPVHRLDKGTSGLLIVAKTIGAMKYFDQAFKNGRIHKTYHALVQGKPLKTGRISHSLNGQKAITNYQLIDAAPSIKNGFVSLLELNPETGRTHQIRKHCAQSGWPIMGDVIYARETIQGKGLFLAATGLQFAHPQDSRHVELKLPIPSKFIKRMEREAQMHWRASQS